MPTLDSLVSNENRISKEFTFRLFRQLQEAMIWRTAIYVCRHFRHQKETGKGGAAEESVGAQIITAPAEKSDDSVDGGGNGPR